MYINTFLRPRSSGGHSIYATGIILLIAIIFSGCSLSLFGNEGSILSTQSTPTDNQSQNQTLAAGFSNIMTATVASTTQSTSDTQSGSGAAGSGKESIVLKEIDGSVQVRQSGQSSFVTGVLDYELMPMGLVKTLDNSNARLEMPDLSILRLGSNSLLTYEGSKSVGTDTTTQFKLDHGAMWVILKSGTLEIDTPSGVAAVQGSFMGVSVAPTTNTVVITCLEGDCSVTNDTGAATLMAGQNATLTDSQPVIGNMAEQEITAWLLNNPEATAVIPALTKTSQFLPTMTPSKTATPSTPGLVAPTTVHSSSITQVP
jgi:hypothetical protein